MTSILTYDLGQTSYQLTWQQMLRFTDQRDQYSDDQLWIVEHDPVFTLGQQGQISHLQRTTHIPIIQTDRGGQITYHGPGQIVLYPLINLRRHRLGVRPLVSLLENTMIGLLADYGIHSYARRDAPGVYVNEAKIGAVGLRVRRGCSYHGCALNVNMDLTPFSYINPCGMQDLQVTQLFDLLSQPPDYEAVKRNFTRYLFNHLGYE